MNQRRMEDKFNIWGTRSGCFLYIALMMAKKVTAIVWFIVSYGVFCEGCESKKCKIAVRTRVLGTHARRKSWSQIGHLTVHSAVRYGEEHFLPSFIFLLASAEGFDDLEFWGWGERENGGIALWCANNLNFARYETIFMLKLSVFELCWYRI